ncbi:hypothetical protein [Paenibacillus qinlingensis]|uniref:Multisubunit Na+/H+ antiporter MnhF subunit n=1 Tax=Paenibacillus qinlingensis TaxID=1837343 RepID=A0ABU1P7G1_9BACL|nr:hypothetical protein [Paenibacillus qinlingensis]MDR6554977.1 multisubunit Na+/H+ antiporter MnhF subunit [Paenibacillus qinlingensis]
MILYRFISFIVAALVFISIYMISLKIVRFVILDHLTLRLQLQSLVEIITLLIIAVISLVSTVSLLRYLVRHR